MNPISNIYSCVDGLQATYSILTQISHERDWLTESEYAFTLLSLNQAGAKINSNANQLVPSLENELMVSVEGILGNIGSAIKTGAKVAWDAFVKFCKGVKNFIVGCFNKLRNIRKRANEVVKVCENLEKSKPGENRTLALPYSGSKVITDVDYATISKTLEYPSPKYIFDTSQEYGEIPDEEYLHNVIRYYVSLAEKLIRTDFFMKDYSVGQNQSVYFGPSKDITSLADTIGHHHNRIGLKYEINKLSNPKVSLVKDIFNNISSVVGKLESSKVIEGIDKMGTNPEEFIAKFWNGNKRKYFDHDLKYFDDDDEYKQIINTLINKLEFIKQLVKFVEDGLNSFKLV